MLGKLPEPRCSGSGVVGAALVLMSGVPAPFGVSISSEPGTVALSTATESRSVSVTGPFSGIAVPGAWRAGHETVTVRCRGTNAPVTRCEGRRHRQEPMSSNFSHSPIPGRLAISGDLPPFSAVTYPPFAQDHRLTVPS